MRQEFIKTGPGYEWVYKCSDVCARVISIAKQLGTIKVKHVCEECTDTKNVDAHHDDYRYPLRVRWLCRSCHMLWHGRHGPGKNRDSYMKLKKFKFDRKLSDLELDTIFDETYFDYQSFKDE